jgi:hypothetical protein
MTVWIDIPTAASIADPQAAWINAGKFDNLTDALSFAQEHFGADDQGRIGLISPSSDELPKPEKFTVWTLASDDEHGTRAAVFTTEYEAYAAMYFAAFQGEDESLADACALQALTEAKKTGDYSEFLEQVERWLQGSGDTYSVDSHEITL